MLRPGSMLHIQKDAWFWGQDGGTAVTALSLLCARVRGFRTTTLGRAHSANLVFHPLLTPLLYRLEHIYNVGAVL